MLISSHFSFLLVLAFSVEKFKFSQILLGDKNATSLCSKNISTLPKPQISKVVVNSYGSLTPFQAHSSKTCS